MVTKHLKQSWIAYRKNFIELLKGIIVRDGLTFSLIFLGLYLVLIGFADFNIVWPILLTAYICSTVLHGGFVKMCYESLKGKTSLKTMFKTTKQRGWSLIGGNGLVAIILIFILIILLGASNFLYGYFHSEILQLFLIFFSTFLIFVFFAFVDQAIVIDNRSSFKSLKRSVEIASKSYLKMIYLFIIISLFLLVSKFSIGLIPVIGQALDLIVNHFLIIPIMLLSLTSIYAEGRKK